MTRMTREDARATIESLVLDAIAETADSTRLRAGPASHRLLKQIVGNLLDRPSGRHALRQYLEEYVDVS